MIKKRFRNALSSIKQEAVRTVQKMQGKQFVHFLHIGKTGGTAIKHAMGQNTADCDYVINLHSHRVKLRDVPKGEHVVFFLRDPISRFVSGFYSRQRQGQPRCFYRWSSEEKEAFEEFESPDQLAIAIASKNVEEKKRACFAMESIQHVRDSYWGWFESEAYFKSRLSDVFFIGFQESLLEDFGNLKTKLHLPESVELPKDNVLAHRNPAELNKKLSETAVENLKDWYQKDFDFIDLCKEVIPK